MGVAVVALSRMITSVDGVAVVALSRMITSIDGGSCCCAVSNDNVSRWG